jgi:prepilin-type N-terminal cleavage/methylation domain-containing protein
MERPAGIPRSDGGPRESGFSLIEIMVAVIIFAIGVLGLAALFPMAMRNVNQGAMITRATQCAQGKIEDLLDAGIGTVGSGADTVGLFHRSWTAAPDSLADGLTTVRVSVLWESGGIERRVNLSSTMGRLDD